MAISIIREEEPYRLIGDGGGQFAVIEARGGRVYSLHGRARHEEDDSAEGMAEVVGDGWRDEATARRRFEAMCRREGRYSEVIW